MNISVLRLVVIIIGLIELVVVCGMVLCVILDKSIPGTFDTIVLAGVTGLLGLLAPSHEVTNKGDA